jgi:hypothetical protein
MKKGLLYTALALALLYVVRELEYAGIRRNEKGEFAKLRESFLEKNAYEMVILGSSRAECQFDPVQIQTRTGLSTYNLGMTGATMPFIRATFEAYLENSAPPEYAVLNLDLHSLNDNPDTVFDFPRYFPYLSNKKLRAGLQERDARFTWFRLFPFYSMPYCGTRYLNAAVRGWADIPGKNDRFTIAGFSPSLPDRSSMYMDTLVYPPVQSVAQPWFWEELNKIDSICRANDCHLILVISPIYARYEASIANYPQVIRSAEDYASAHRIPLINLSGLSLKESPQYFSDHAHLYHRGVFYFTSEFSTQVRQYLTK